MKDGVYLRGERDREGPTKILSRIGMYSANVERRVAVWRETATSNMSAYARRSSLSSFSIALNS